MPRPITPTGALRAWYSIGIVLLTTVGILVGGLLYINYALDKSDRRWCALLSIQAAPTPAPSTPRGEASQAEAQRLVAQFGCPAPRQEAPR